MEEILRFEHVSYAYEEEREALLDVCAGERVAVLGSNGAGKSTFFLLANGVLRPGAGRILFRGAPVGGGAKQLNVLRRGVGLVFQDPEVQLLGGSVEEEVRNILAEDSAAASMAAYTSTCAQMPR